MNESLSDNFQDEREDWLWDLCQGYTLKCTRCQQVVRISGECRGGLLCETCSPTED